MSIDEINHHYGDLFCNNLKVTNFSQIKDTVGGTLEGIIQ
jgi:hypothetical protein